MGQEWGTDLMGGGFRGTHRICVRNTLATQGSMSSGHFRGVHHVPKKVNLCREETLFFLFLINNIKAFHVSFKWCLCHWSNNTSTCRPLYISSGHWGPRLVLLENTLYHGKNKSEFSLLSAPEHLGMNFPVISRIWLKYVWRALEL